MSEKAPGELALCPTVQAAFDLLGKKWTGLILRRLMGGPLCFSELVRAVPALSPRMLALRVKELEMTGMVARSVSMDTPVRVSYALTAKGQALEPVLRGIEDWARAWNENLPGEAPEVDTGNEKGIAVAPASALE